MQTKQNGKRMKESKVQKKEKERKRKEYVKK